MKSVLSLFFALILCMSTELRAREYRQVEEKPKVYVPYESLRFTEEGIYFQTEESFKKIKHLGHDQGGYYLDGAEWAAGISSYFATCVSCEAEFHNDAPQPCKECEQAEGLELQYENVWDYQN